MWDLKMIIGLVVMMGLWALLLLALRSGQRLFMRKMHDHFVAMGGVPTEPENRHTGHDDTSLLIGDSFNPGNINNH